MTYIENNSHHNCEVTVTHGCGMSWSAFVRSGQRYNLDTYHMCPVGYCGINVNVQYSAGYNIGGPAHDDASVYISDNEVRPYRVSSI
jgi:hypothetical protein